MLKTSSTLLCLILTCGCTISRPPIQQHTESGAEYERLYPYYVEVCAVSQISPRGTLKGGRHGHAVIYLKGACRDPAGSYPRIQMCPEGTDLSDSESGVGISVDKMFRSVNWAAVPGRKLFFKGNLEENQTLDAGAFDAAVQRTLELGVFDGVEFHDAYLQGKPAGMSAREFVARESAGTDYALNFGRTAFCARLPVTRDMLQKSVDYLNQLNGQYASGKADYHWSGYSDNCAHTVHNALAAAGIWKSKSVNQVRWQQFFHLAIPANEFVNLAFYSNQQELSPGRVWREDAMRNSLQRDRWLPVRHGALLSVIPAHPHNELYDRQFTIFLLDRPLSRGKSRRIQRMAADKKYTDMKTNLEFFGTFYQEVLDKSCRQDMKDPFRRNFCSYVGEQINDVNIKLNQMTGV